MRKDLTVLMPVFNTEAACLLEAVNSIVNQSIDRAFKIFIVNDGSTNPETLMMLDYIKKRTHSFRDITIHNSLANEGTSAALNKGHELIDSEYVAIMGSDDISEAHRLELQMKFIEKRPDIDVLGANLFSFYHDDIHRHAAYISSHKEFPKAKDVEVGKGFVVNHGTVIYKNQIVKDVGGYNIDYKRGQDVNLWARLSKENKTFANLPQVLYAWRRFR